MQKLLQLAAGAGAIFWLAHYIHGTPLNHWSVYAVAGLGAAYAVAWVAAHWGPLKRGRADRVPGIRP